MDCVENISYTIFCAQNSLGFHHVQYAYPRPSMRESVRYFAVTWVHLGKINCKILTSNECLIKKSSTDLCCAWPLISCLWKWVPFPNHFHPDVCWQCKHIAWKNPYKNVKKWEHIFVFHRWYIRFHSALVQASCAKPSVYNPGKFFSLAAC